jgi:hypothetical protein
MKWLPLHPRPQRKDKPLDLPPKPPPTEEEKREPMRWKIDPNSEAVDALRLLREKMERDIQDKWHYDSRD